MKVKSSQETRVVPVRPINKLEYHLAKKFQGLLGIVIRYADIRYPKRENYLDFRKEVHPYLKYKFTKYINQMIQKTDKELQEIDRAREKVPEIRKEFSTKVKKLEELFLSKNIEESLKILPEVKQHTESLNKASQPEEELVKVKNPFFISGMSLIFSGGKKSGPLQSFEKEDAEKLMDKDLHEYKYTFLNLPKNKLDDYEYMVVFIQNLRKEPKPVRLKPYDFRIWKTFLYTSNPEYQELEKLVDGYLYSNDKVSLQKVINMLPKFPELTKATQKIAQQNKIAYRGIPLFQGNLTEKQIKQKEPKYAAASWSESVAERFAQARGHMEQQVRSERGAILTYRVPKDAAILDTSVFGGVFGETEVIIDTTLAKLESINIRYWDIEREEEEEE